MALFRCASGSSGGGATITVTYSSDFYGETVTCSHGTKTYSKVATSSGTLEFSVDEEGTWTISCTIGSDTFSTTADVDLSYDAELASLPNGETVLPTDDIETWLACAAITDKAYTTLSQVLGDSETYNALLGDSNACAYMKRSTTWSTDICASQYAMNLLGQYDTACDALLSDSTWTSAIANSTYFESVLNVKVPKMTSDTAPSGTAFYDGSASNQAYYAFDGKDNTNCAPNSYIGYTFTSATAVNKLSVKANANTYQLQASNDGFTTVVDIGSPFTTTTDVLVSFSFNNDTTYESYRIYATSGTKLVYTLQFYGRTTSSEKIHGANGESAYILDGGSPVTITDPSTLDAGTYTVYSTVAKNPSDLTADYSKTIRICPNTKEIVVRPDGALYWWGYEDTNLDYGNGTVGFTPSSNKMSSIVDHIDHMRTDSTVDVTNYDDLSIVLKMSSTQAPSHSLELYCLTTKPNQDAIVSSGDYQVLSQANKGTLECQTYDISAISGDKYCGFQAYSATADGVTEVYALFMK